MKIVGIIAEFNPFHNGHAYIIEEAKRRTGADYCVVVMSGDFVQSGKPAFCSKELRARMTLSCGADAVFMLPVTVSTASAEIFAEGAVALLEKLGCVDALCFGSECSDLPLLKSIADVLVEEPDAYRRTLQQQLAAGKSFPAAREEALNTYFAPLPVRPVLSSSNAILGIEYLKALKRLNSSIVPVPILRKSISHLEATMTKDASYCSATALRRYISESEGSRETVLRALTPYVPESILSLYQNALFTECPVSPEGLTSWLLHRLLSGNAADFSSISDCDEPLANALAAVMFKNGNIPLTYDGLLAKLTTKNYTKNRISRVLTHLLLDIKKTDLTQARSHHYCLYARLLGFCKDSTPLLHAIKDRSRIPIISKLADRHVLTDWYDKEPETSALALLLLDQDISAGNQYSLLQQEAWNGPLVHETRKQIIKK